MKPGPTIAFVLLVGSAIVTFLSFSRATAKHVSIAEAKRSSGVVVQVPGKVDHSTVSLTTDGSTPKLRFEVTDLQGSGERMTVVYSRAKPENFASCTSVEVVGRFQDGEFHAHTLLVKCPSRYQADAGS